MTNAVTMPEAFQLSSGLREDMVISIHSAYFAPDAGYQDGRVLMLWLIGTDEDNEPVDIRMSVGGDWQTADGNLIVHPTKKRQQINKNTIYGHFLQHSFEIPALAQILIERSDALGGKGPLDARIWSNLIIHLQAREIVFGKNIDPQDRLMPTEFFGTVDAPTTPAPAPQTPPPVPPNNAAPAPAPTNAPAAADPMAAINAARAAKAAAEAPPTNGSPLYNRAVELAKSSPDFPTFLAAALDDAEILSDDELAVQCADESQIWASVH